MGDLREFAKRIRLKGEAVEKNTDEIVRRTALVIDSAVVMRTPVKTGRARANWRAQLGSANGETLPAPASPADGAQQALQEAQAAVAGYQGEGAIHITNSLPYIKPLNDGHSSQAPAGFIETAVQDGARAVQSARNLTGTLEMETVEIGPAAGAGSAPSNKGGA